MREDPDSAQGQLQRADHLLYITLKYTRTVDVIKNIIKRLIGAFDYAMKEVLEADKEIKKIPGTPKERALAFEKLFPKNKAIRDYVDFYFLLKKLEYASFSKRQEYRKNVALIVDCFTVDIEMLKRYYYKTKDFVKFTREYAES